MAADNRSLGKFILDGIPPAPRGVPQVEVTFDIDANGILNVSAKDKATGKEQKIVIQASSGLSDQEIERMRKDAESHEADDQKKRELVELRNRADTMVYTAEKTLKDADDKVKPEDKRAVEDAVLAVKGVLGKDDVDALKSELEKLETKLSEVGASLYQQPGESAPTDETNADNKKSDEPTSDDAKKDE